MNRRHAMPPGAQRRVSAGHATGRVRPPATQLDSEIFEQLVAEALEALPEFFRAHMRNVEVVVQDWPDAGQLAGAGVPSGSTLLGLYEGVPLTRRSDNDNLLMPDLVTIFQGPIERHAGLDPQAVREQVRHTVMHEIAHHFGISDERMLELGVY